MKEALKYLLKARLEELKFMVKKWQLDDDKYDAAENEIEKVEQLIKNLE